MLRRLVHTVRRTVSPKAQAQVLNHFMLLDTSDAKDGLVEKKLARRTQAELGSTKKLAPLGSVLISRLRPYLRQVAFLDVGLLDVLDASDPSRVQLACSTEFVVLTGQDQACIAFLVPWLLSASVQAVLAAAQEGGLHPRFGEQTLLDCPVPAAWVRKRRSLSAQVRAAIAQVRCGSNALAGLAVAADVLDAMP